MFLQQAMGTNGPSAATIMTAVIREMIDTYNRAPAPAHVGVDSQGFRIGCVWSCYVAP